MKFNCDKGILLDAINIVSKAVSGKSSIPILEGILLTAQNQTIKLTANDLELGIESTIDAEILNEGSIVVNARMFNDIVRSLPDGMVSVECSDETNQMIIDAGATHFEIKCLSGEEFPQIPKIDQSNTFQIESSKLKSMIRQTLFAIGTNENRFILTGSLFELNDNSLRIVSVDGFRLAVRKEEIEACGIFDSFVVPGKTLSELTKLLADTDDKIVVSFSDKNVLFEMENSIVISRLLEGEFLNYEQILPKTCEIQVMIHAGDFLRSLERTALIISAADNNKCPSVLSVHDQSIDVSCTSSVGVLKDSVLAQITGGELEIGFNHKYLTDALKACDGEIKLEFNTHLSPCVMKPKDGSDQFVYIVLPVRLKNE